MDQEPEIAYTLCEYAKPGMAPVRSEFTDLGRAEKAFEKVKGAAILFETRPPAHGLHWKKVMEKSE